MNTIKANTTKALNEAIAEFQENMKFEFETSKASDEVKHLTEQVARMTYYTLNKMIEILAKD